MRDTKLADSNARKARMQAMDRERANKVPPTDIEQANRNKDVGILIKAAEEKRERNLRLIAEVEAANKIALAKKQEMHQKELDEEQNIVRYNQEKVAREVA